MNIHLQKGEVPYNDETEKVKGKQITNLGNIGETMCKYKNAYNVHKFIENAPSHPQEGVKTEYPGKKFS